MRAFSFGHFGIRFLFSTLLVFLTYNPTPYCYVHWLLETFPSINPLLALSGVVLLIGWVIFIRATFRSLGAVGLLLGLLFFACVMWLFIDLGWLAIDNISALTWIALVIASALLALGMSWSHIRRRISGQVDTDDVET